MTRPTVPTHGLPGWWVLLLIPGLSALIALGVLLAAPSSSPEPTATVVPVAMFPSPPPVRFETPTPRPTPSPQPTIAQPALGTSVTDLAFETLDGETIRLADLSGQIVFLNIWATWCVPCREEMPELQQLHDSLGESGITVIALTDPTDGQTLDTVRAFQADYNLTLPIALASDPALFQRLGVEVIPTTLVIDPGGVVRFVHIGAMHDHDMLDYIAALTP